jgi:hypothetical protein
MAVQEHNLSSAVSASEAIRREDFDELYDRWANEITLSSRSLRERVREDIEKVLHLVDTWQKTTRPVDKQPEARLRALIERCFVASRRQECENAEERACAALGRWLFTFGTDATGGFTADFPLQSADIFQQLLPPTLRLEPAEWRAFGSQMERGSATWGDWCLDQLAHWSGAVSVDTSVRRLLELKCFVAASQAADMFTERGQTVDVALLNQLRAELVNVRHNLATELDAFRAELARFEPQDRQLIEAEMPTAPEPPTVSACEIFRQQISALRQLMAQILADYSDEASRRSLSEQLLALGRPALVEASLDDLRTSWQSAWEQTAGKRGHLEPIRKFRDFVRQAGLVNVTNAADLALASLEMPIHWCSLQDTTDIELHFDVLFIDKLQPALAWVDRLMPESRRDLLRLTESWLGALSMPDWLAEPGSAWWQALRRTAEFAAINNPELALAILVELDLPIVTDSAPEKSPPFPEISQDVEDPDRHITAPTRATPLERLRAALDTFIPDKPGAPLVVSELRRAFVENRWEEAVALAGSEYRRLEGQQQATEKHGRDLLVDLGAAVVFSLADDRPLDLEATAALLHALNGAPESAVRTDPGAADRLGSLFKRCFLDAWAAEFALRQPVRELVAEQFRSYARTLSTDSLPGRLNRWLVTSFTPCASDPKTRCPMVDAAWEVLPGSSSDTSVRGWLLWMCLQTNHWPALQRLLLLSNPEVMSADQAQYFRLLVEDRERNWLRFTSFIADLRMRSPKRPTFLNFTERLLQSRQVVKGPLLKVELLDKLEQQRDGQTWLGQIHIKPPEIDPPATLSLTLPESGDLQFAPDRAFTKVIEGGPFLQPSEIYCEFAVNNPQTTELRLQVRCTGKTLSERPFDLVQEWDAQLRSEVFDPPDPEQINRIFRDFSPNPVTGNNYVRRPWDEQALRQVLFLSDKPGSVWVRAPRRSGKTSLLLRLIDEHSLRADHPTVSGLIHVNVSTWGPSTSSFVRHVWSEFLSSPRNAGLRRN